MKFHKTLKIAFAASALLAGLIAAVHAENFSIAASDLKSALDAYARQAGVALAYREDAVAGVRSKGVAGDLSADAALAHILSGTGFVARRHENGAVAIVRDDRAKAALPSLDVAAASAVPIASGASLETVTVTSSKIGGDVQNIPIAITAMSQEQLTSRQVAGGPDLVKEVPNLTFSKTNFTGYNIQIRGIGTQAISVTTDPAVAVALNDIPFIRNHFFEQEFYDLSQAEVLRGPQGTLYGRNATAGVVNIVSAKPTDQFEAMASADIGNYQNRRLEGMINVPIVDDRLDLRIAGEWTKRKGYSFNDLTDASIDGRDLWSSRVSLGWKPFDKVQAYLIWEHFSEDDDRLRTAKQLCKYDPGPATVLGQSTAVGSDGHLGEEYLSQGCSPVSLYSKDAFETPNSLSLPYYGGLIGAAFGESISNPLGGDYFDAYSDKVQSTNLRVIESTLNPTYRAKSDVVELNTDYAIAPALTFTSQTAFNHDFLWSTEDYNRFNTAPGIFEYDPAEFGTLITPEPTDQFRCDDGTIVTAASSCTNPYSARPFGMFCDPQLGCSDRLVAEDLSDEHAWQLSQEFRLASNFSGPLNFSVGGNYLHYETEENYYVFINTLTMYNAKGLIGAAGQPDAWVPGVSNNEECTQFGGAPTLEFPNPKSGGAVESCLGYIDPNPITSLNNQGHNYFLSENPYVLNSYAGFGEAYYQVVPELKLTGGLRWTDDQKHFIDIPSELLESDAGYPAVGIVNQKWNELTGRFTANWTPKLDFTEQTLVYGSYAHGYKAGGANPPGAALLTFTSGDIAEPVHPLTFKPEFIDAFELGTKNTMLDGTITFNGDVFYYNYKAYQISEIVDRTAINLNFNAKVKGAELETSWEPLPGLKFNFAGGYEDARVDNGQSAVDLMDRTAGNPNWLVVKPFVTQASNCILPAYVVAQLIKSSGYGVPSACGLAYNLHYDPAVGGDSGAPYQANPYSGYPGFDPCAGNTSCSVYALNASGQFKQTGTIDDPYTGQNTYNGIDYGPAPNNGEGFAKNVGGNQLPNAPHFTTSVAADFTLPINTDWAATLHGDFYWQANSFARVFNDKPYDQLRGYTNVNLAAIFTNQNGWQVMGYVKNVFDTTAITGAFLNSDDTDLTTNVFLTDPRLFGVRVTKNW